MRVPKNLTLALMLSMVLAIPTASYAALYTYEYEGNPYTYGLKGSEDFTFVNNGPIALGTDILSWSFTDGSASINSSTDANLFFRIVTVDGNISQWDIWTDLQPSGAGYPVFFNTTSGAYDWSQHSDGSYGGNHGSLSVQHRPYLKSRRT